MSKQKYLHSINMRVDGGRCMSLNAFIAMIQLTDHLQMYKCSNMSVFPATAQTDWGILRKKIQELLIRTRRNSSRAARTGHFRNLFGLVVERTRTLYCTTFEKSGRKM